MKQFIVYKWHRDNGTGVISINKDSNSTKIIEQGQRNMKKQGLSDGITWQRHEGNFVSALVAANRL